MTLASYSISSRDQTITIAGQTFHVSSTDASTTSQSELEELAVIFSVVNPDYLSLLAQGVQRTNVFNGQLYDEEAPLQIVFDSSENIIETSANYFMGDLLVGAYYDNGANQLVIPRGFTVEYVLHELNHAIDDFLYATDSSGQKESLNPERTQQLNLPSMEVCDQYPHIEEYRKLYVKGDDIGLTTTEEQTFGVYVEDLLALGLLQAAACTSQNEAIAYSHYYTAQQPYEDLVEICAFQFKNPRVSYERKESLCGELVRSLRSGNPEANQSVREQINKLVFHSSSLDEYMQHTIFLGVLSLMFQQHGEEQKRTYDFLVSVLSDKTIDRNFRMSCWVYFLGYGLQHAASLSETAPNFAKDLQEIVKTEALIDSSLSEDALKGLCNDLTNPDDIFRQGPEEQVVRTTFFQITIRLLFDPQMTSKARRCLIQSLYTNSEQYPDDLKLAATKIFRNHYCQSSAIPLADRIDFVHFLIEKSQYTPKPYEQAAEPTRSQSLLFDLSTIEALPSELGVLVAPYGEIK